MIETATLPAYLPTHDRLWPGADRCSLAWSIWTEAAAPAAGPLSRAEAERAERVGRWGQYTEAEAIIRGYAITRIGWSIDVIEYAYHDGGALFRVFCGPSLVERTEDRARAYATWADLVRSYAARVALWPLDVYPRGASAS